MNTAGGNVSEGHLEKQHRGHRWSHRVINRSTSEYISRGVHNEIGVWKVCLHSGVHCSINSQDTGTTKLPTHGLMENKNMVCIHSRILFSPKVDCSIQQCGLTCCQVKKARLCIISLTKSEEHRMVVAGSWPGWENGKRENVLTRVSFSHLLYSLVTDANNNVQLFQNCHKDGF